MTTDLAIPTPRELEALTPSDRWDIEDAIGEAQDSLREFNDEELHRWVEDEGKTYREIGELVGRNHSRISRRCSRLGISSQSNRGGDRFGAPAPNDDEQVIDAEVVEDSPRPKARRSSPEGPAHHFPDVVAEDADQNVRTQALGGSA